MGTRKPSLEVSRLPAPSDLMPRPCAVVLHDCRYIKLQTSLTLPLTTEPRSGSDRVVHTTLNFVVNLILCWQRTANEFLVEFSGHDPVATAPRSITAPSTVSDSMPRPCAVVLHDCRYVKLQTSLTLPLTTEPRSGSDRVVHTTRNFVVKLILCWQLPLMGSWLNLAETTRSLLLLGSVVEWPHQIAIISPSVTNV
jgi:hypothetical protein